MQLAELGEHKKALDVFDDILRKFKDNVNVIYAKSRSKAALDMYPEALELLKQAVSKNPKIIRVWAKEEKIFEKLHGNEQFRKLVKL